MNIGIFDLHKFQNGFWVKIKSIWTLTKGKKLLFIHWILQNIFAHAFFSFASCSMICLIYAWTVSAEEKTQNTELQRN